MSKVIKQEVLELSEKIQKGLEINKDSTATVAENLYVNNLPSTLTEDVVTKVSDYNAQFIAASGHAVGVLATAAMVKHKSMDSVEVKIPTIGKDYVEHTFTRTSKHTNAFAKEGEDKTITKHGTLSTTYSVRAGKNKGALNAVRDTLSEAANKLFSK